MPTKIDALLSELLGLREALGGFRSDIKTLFQRATEDRIEREREHRENQQAMGEMRQGMQAAMAELRDTASRRYEETTHAVADLTEQVKSQGEKLDDHARAVTALQIGRGKLAALALVGFAALTVLMWAIEAGFQWLVTHGLKKLFGV